MVINWFRKAAIGHGVFSRALAGNASSSKALELGEGFAFMLQLGLQAAGFGAGAIEPDFSEGDYGVATAQSRL